MPTTMSNTDNDQATIKSSEMINNYPPMKNLANFAENRS